MKIKFLVFLAMLAVPTTLWGQEIKILNPEVKPGEVLVIQTPLDLSIQVFGKTYSPNKNGIVFVGLDLNIQPRTYFVNASKPFQVSAVEVKVRRRKPSRIGPKRRKELEMLGRAYAGAEVFQWYPSEDFGKPLVITEPTSDFAIGHGGVDLRAQKPTSAQAINAGKVLMVARRFSLEGNMVIIDHGSGVLSFYMHLSQIAVKDGQLVKKGQSVGLTGGTGAVTGPHLHFSVKVNGTNVDPLAFIETINRYLE